MLELEKFSSLNMNGGENKNLEILTILLIGSTGGGKSTLANVLSGSNNYDVSSSSVSSTKDTNVNNFEIDGKIYKIVDTVGIGDTKMTPKEVISKLTIAAEAIKYGINQVLFVTSGRFTDVEIDAFETLESVVFDKSIFEFTTIVRTNFHDFEDDDECKKDHQAMISENEKLSELVKSCNKLIHVDNPPITKRSKQVAEEIRVESRKKLINYLKTCTKVYVPEKLQEVVDAKINGYMTHKERLQKEVNDLNGQLSEGNKKRKELDKKIKELQKRGCIIS
ncbi:11325_t:CDS:1 [Entrophospora sp. SA101]|nr:11325_t:CDS:1 [Entrophospora sp. SA101]CAJ0845210.1 7560_t:CDS:1 [Entrophospora sp. SA101]CAJ0912438.1 12416_t:CDS:1 [Entrophospora sp. SA101]